MGAKEFPGTKPETPYLNNHLRFIIKYHRDDKFEGARLVGFEVTLTLTPISPITRDLDP